MLVNGTRELAYIVKIDEVKPIPGYDRVEHVRTGGWWVICKLNQFKPGDYAIYFEIDSKVPAKEPFMFLEPKHFKIKTQKMCKTISQGLLMALEDFEGTENGLDPGWLLSLRFHINKGDDITHEGLTEMLGVTYAVDEDNKRKANSEDKYKKMAQRRPNIFKKPWARWMMKREWGRKVMFFFFGKKKDKKNGWPSWVAKTDEERIENCIFWLKDKEPWVATEKLDGSSTTATYRKVGKKKHVFYICSRNVVFDKPDKKCYYDTNIYTEMAEKYHFEEVLENIIKKYGLEWVTLQGETYGDGIQKNTYDLTGHDFAGFNLIFSNRGRLNSVEAKEIMSVYGIPWVPIIDDNFILPDTLDELRAFVDSQPSIINKKMKEGIVFRSQDGTKSFKCVSPNYLLKYHQ